MKVQNVQVSDTTSDAMKKKACTQKIIGYKKILND